MLSEFAPSLETGIVGVTDSCLLGYNQNKGEKIALRLRTDDYGGFRHYHVIIQTLLHELAHMVHGPHDRQFWALFRQLRKEYDSLHWSKTSGRALSGRAAATGAHHRMVPPALVDSSDGDGDGGGVRGAGSKHAAPAAVHGGVHVLGTQSPAARGDMTPAQAARAAALKRAEQQQQQQQEEEEEDKGKKEVGDQHQRKAQKEDKEQGQQEREQSARQVEKEKGTKRALCVELTPARKAQVLRNAMLAEETARGTDPYTYRPRRSVQVGRGETSHPQPTPRSLKAALGKHKRIHVTHSAAFCCLPVPLCHRIPGRDPCA